MCIFNSKKRRITVLLGAGAMIEATGVGTGTITQKILEVCKGVKICNVPILEWFSREFNKKHKKDIYERKANFEDLFDLLEELVGYMYTESNDSASAILSELKELYRNNIDYKTVSSLRRKVLNAINNTVASYDQQYSTNGTCNCTWMRDFFHRYIEHEKVILDIFNLNYDTWLEQILEPYGYEDGFAPIEGYDDFQRFIVAKYLNHENKHTVSHLHGSIGFSDPAFKPDDINKFMYEEQEFTLYKYKDFTVAEDFRKRHSRSDIITQSGHVIFPANIITGRMKTDKLLWAPMQMYMYAFIKALMENEELFIIGYGFGDQYINYLLFQYLQKHGKRTKIHMITKCEEKHYEENILLYGNPFQDRQAIFSQCMMEDIEWCSPFHRQGRYKAKNSNSEIYIDGFKKFCEEYV